MLKRFEHSLVLLLRLVLWAGNAMLLLSSLLYKKLQKLFYLQLLMCVH